MNAVRRRLEDFELRSSALVSLLLHPGLVEELC